MSILESRFFRLFRPSQDVSAPTLHIEDLRSTLISAIQDIVVLKAMLQEKGLWDEPLYKRLRIQRMIDDHSSAGCASWLRYSFYPYTLEQSDFLRHQFKATEDEIKSFEAQVRFVQTLT
jgi:hypothetical protein